MCLTWSTQKEHTRLRGAYRPLGRPPGRPPPPGRPGGLPPPPPRIGALVIVFRPHHFVSLQVFDFPDSLL
jgi:hypothetical protein